MSLLEGWKHRYTILLICWLGWIFIYLTKSALPLILPILRDELKINFAQAGLLETAYLIGYIAIKMPSGILGKKFGARKVLAVGVLGYAVCTLLISVTSSYLQLFVLRLLIGLFQGVHLPVANSLLSKMFGKDEGRAIGFHESGPNVGNTIAYPITVSIASSLGWRYAFFIMSIPPFLLATIILLFMKEEETYMDSLQSQEVTRTEKIRDYISLLIPFAIAHATYNLLLRTLFIFIPLYLVEYRQLSLASAGFLAMILPAAGIISKISSGYHNEKLGGKKAISTSILLSGFFLVLMVFIKGELFLAINFIFLGLTLYSFSPIIYSSTTSSLPIGIKSLGLGIVTMIGNIVGALSTTIVGVLVDRIGFNQAFIDLSVLSILLGLITFTLIKE